MFFYLVRFLLAILLLANKSLSVPEKARDNKHVPKSFPEEQNMMMTNTEDLIIAQHNHALHDIAFPGKDDTFGSSFQPDNNESNELRFFSNEIDSKNWKRSLPETVPREWTTNVTGSISRLDDSAITRYQMVSSEQDDMLHSAVTPHDEDPVDDDEDSAQIQPRMSMPEPTTSSVPTTEKTMLPAINTSLPPMVFPNDEDIKSIANVSKDVVEKMNETIYDTIKSDPDNTFNSAHTMGSNHSPVASSSSTNTPNVFVEQNGEPNATSEFRNKSENNFNTLETSLTKRIKEMKGLEKINSMEVVSKENGENSKDNPSSTIVTVFMTLLALAVVVTIGYVGIIVWKRYLRNHYWNRELLINDLDVDINDLHHFEL